MSRTFIGSVVCIDLVGYSTRSVEQQITIKDAFNRVLAQALEPIAEEDRIILDTGDGASISFLGDPEQSLAVGLTLRDATKANAAALGAAAGAEGAVRIGFNLGPVKLAVDMNGYPKIIGDGLNVAERIMSFARPGQVTASRPFVEMVSRLSDEYAKLFRFEGARTDKNSREHQVYVMEPGVRPGKGGGGANGGVSGALAEFLEDKLKVGGAAAVLLAVILGEGTMLAKKLRDRAPTVASAPVEAPAALPAPAPAPATKAEAPKASTRAAEPSPAKPAPSAVVPPPSKASEPAKPEVKADPKADPAKTAAAKAAVEPISPVQPNLVDIAPLNFPNEAAARGYTSGSVRARLTIDAAGNVTKVQILSAQPARGFFDEEATRSLRNWKFDRGPSNRQYVADIQFKK